MKPITELDLRLELKDSQATRYQAPAGAILTPSAREYLRARQVELVAGPAGSSPGPLPPVSEKAPPAAAAEALFSGPASEAKAYVSPLTRGREREQIARAQTEAEKAELAKAAPSWPKDRRMTGPDGGYFDEKPEGLTNIYGLQLVPKNHPVIIYRGKLDSFCAKILEAQLLGVQHNRPDFSEQLAEVLQFCRNLLSAEFRRQPLGEFYLLGLTAADLRAQSHDPIKFFGYRHLLASYKMGPLCLALNSLRAEVREVELAAYTAFKNDDHTSRREDIIKALNRLSSLFYIMMFRFLPEGFVPEASGI